MSARVSVICLGLLPVVLLWPSSATSQSAVAADAGKVVAAGQNVFLTLRIADTQSGLILDAKRPVAKGSNAFRALRDTVVVKYKTFPELGAFVTGLCGVDAPKGMVWTFTVDTKWSEAGIERVTLEQDTVIEWKLR